MSTSSGDYGEQGNFTTDAEGESPASGSFGDDDPQDGMDNYGSPGAVDDTGPIPGAGALLQQPDDGKVFRAIDDTVQRQERLARNREEKKRHWDNVRANEPFAYLEHSEDRSMYKAVVAPGVDGDAVATGVPNKMDDLCNKVISQILADDFLPDPKPDGDADTDRGAADLAKKFLRSDGQTSGTDDRQLVRDALNSNITSAAEGVLVWVDPTGGGWRPMQVMAHPRATDANKPLYAPRLGDDGQPVMTDAGPIMEKSAQPQLRYVATLPAKKQTGAKGAPVAGSVAPGRLVFVDDATQADRQWLPKHRRKLLSLTQIRCVPQSASVFEASSITLLMYDSLGEAKKRFQMLRTLKPADLKALTQWKWRRWKTVVPTAHQPKDSESGGVVTDDTLLFWYEHYCRPSPDYPDGAMIAVTGNGARQSGAQRDGTVLLRDTLREDVEVEDGVKAPILMGPPVSVFSCVNDLRDRDPMGSALLARFGGGKEAHDQIWAGMFDAMFKALNPNVYIGATSTVTKEDVNRRDGTPIDILTKDDMPTFEAPPALPEYVPQLLQELDKSFNSAAGTNETSNGLDSEYATSGVAKEVAIKTARVALAQYWQNTVKGLCYYWRVKLQLAQMKLTVPQMVRLTGVESAYKQPWFVGADMCGVAEVALQAGSGTMMTPTEKAQHLGFLQGQEWIDKEQAGDLARASMQDDLGLPLNVHEEAANRDVAAWSKGPPAGWVEQMQQYLQDMQAYQQAIAQVAQQQQQQQAAQLAAAATPVAPADPTNPAAVAPPAAPAPPPPPPEQVVQASGMVKPTAPAVPFEDRPCHQEQLVAIVRHRAFSRMMDTVEYAKQPTLWRQPFDERYEQARVAAGLTTVAEQQQQQGQAADDANYQKFLQTIDEKARTLVEATIATTLDQQLGIAGAKGGLPMPGAPAQPAPLDPAAEADKERAFKADQADRDRALEAENNARSLMSKEAVSAQKTAGISGQTVEQPTPKLPLKGGARP